MGAVVAHSIGSMLVFVYFVLASALAEATFFGGEVTASQERQSDALGLAAFLALLVCGVSIAVVAFAQSAYRDRWGDRLLSWWVWLATGWVLGVLAARLALPLVSNPSKAVAFGVVWLVIGAVVVPAALIGTQARKGPVDGAV